MRVQYTISGLQPRPSGGLQTSWAEGSFRGRLIRLSKSLPLSWKKILRLDKPSTGLEFIEPPPLPEDLESFSDPVLERQRWRQLLDRKARLLKRSSGVEQDSEKQRAIKQMLGLFLTYEVMEDELLVKQLSSSQE